MTYTIPKGIAYFCSVKVGYSIAIFAAVSSMLYMTNDIGSKPITEIWADIVYYNSYPAAVGVFAMSIAQGAAFTFLLSVAIGGAVALASDYLWTAYEEGSLQVLPSSLGFAYDAIFG